MENKTILVTYANRLGKKERERYTVNLRFEFRGLRFAVCDKKGKYHTGIIALLTKDGKEALNVAHHNFEADFAQKRMENLFTSKQPILDFLRENCLGARNEKARLLTARLLAEYEN